MKKIALLLLLTVTATADDTTWPGGIAMLDIGAAEGAPPVVEFDPPASRWGTALRFRSTLMTMPTLKNISRLPRAMCR
jgi:hypothetical protein